MTSFPQSRKGWREHPFPELCNRRTGTMTIEQNVEELQPWSKHVYPLPRELPEVQGMSEKLFSGCEVSASLVDDGRFTEEPYILIAVACPASIPDNEIVKRAVQWHTLLVEVAPNSTSGLFRLDVISAQRLPV